MSSDAQNFRTFRKIVRAALDNPEGKRFLDSLRDWTIRSATEIAHSLGKPIPEANEHRLALASLTIALSESCKDLCELPE